MTIGDGNDLSVTERPRLTGLRGGGGVSSSWASSAWWRSPTCNTAGRCSSIRSIRSTGGASRAIQLTFTIAITTETFLVVPLGGRLVDRFGPKLVVRQRTAGRDRPGISIPSPTRLYLFYFAAVISGLGAGLVFASSNGNALRWFPDRRGLAIGLTAAGFAGGGVLTAVPLDGVIKSYGYETAYLWFGLGQGLCRAADRYFAARAACRARLPRYRRRGCRRASMTTRPRDVLAVAAVLADVRHVRAGWRRRS